MSYSLVPVGLLDLSVVSPTPSVDGGGALNNNFIKLSSAINFRGNWNSSTGYVVNDLVDSGGVPYLAINNSSGGSSQPPNPSYWLTLASGYLPLSGGTLSGTLNMGGGSITNAQSVDATSFQPHNASTGLSMLVSGGIATGTGAGGNLTLQGGGQQGSAGNGGNIIIVAGTSTNGSGGNIELIDSTGTTQATISSNGLSCGFITGPISSSSTLSVSSNLVATNAALSNLFSLTLTSSSWTISNPTNGSDGQKIVWRLTQDSTGGRTIAWDTAFDWGTSSSPTLTAAPNKTDYFVGVYDAGASRWDMIDSSMGHGRTVITFSTIGTTSWNVPTGVTSVEVLVVGGGGGGANNGGGAGGAGGIVYQGSHSVTPGAALTVTVGAGGTGQAAGSSTSPTAGDNSIFDSITAYGGGYGGSAGSVADGGPGGSGGGGSAFQCTGPNFGGAGVSGQGNTGGSSSSTCGAGGGGGAGAAGGAGGTNVPGNGGDGLQFSISGTLTYYGGGGGGGSSYYGGPAGSGGQGGGGGGSGAGSNVATPGSANTGGGGGGGWNGYYGGGANGGSGIVIVKF